MALFFDQPWFNGKLAERGLTKDDIARHLGLSIEQVHEVWKDQRELSVRDVSALAHYLDVPAADIALRAGVSTPIPKDRAPGLEAIGAKLDMIIERLERVEQELRALKLDRVLREHGPWPGGGPVAPES